MNIKIPILIAAAALTCGHAHALPTTVSGRIKTEWDTHQIKSHLSVDGKTVVSVGWHHNSVGAFGPYPLTKYSPPIVKKTEALVFVYRWNPNNGGFYELTQIMWNPVTDGSIYFGGPNGGVGPNGAGVFMLQPATGMSGGVTPSPMPLREK